MSKSDEIKNTYPSDSMIRLSSNIAMIDARPLVIIFVTFHSRINLRYGFLLILMLFVELMGVRHNEIENITRTFLFWIFEYGIFRSKIFILLIKTAFVSYHGFFSITLNENMRYCSVWLNWFPLANLNEIVLGVAKFIFCF